MEHVRSGGSRGGVYLRDLRYRAADAQHRVKAAPELLKKSTGFLKCESEENRKYGRGFYETVASDLNYKQRFIHSFKCVYMLKDYQPFQANDFEYLRGEDTDPPPGANCFHGDAPHRRVLQRNGERE